MDRIVTPKQSCPRDLGFWYCQNCINRQAESQSEVGFVVPITFCSTKYGDRICGETHQGYELCKDCIVTGREKYAHIGEYETVATVDTGADEQAKQFILEVNRRDYFKICELWALAESMAHDDSSIPQEVKDLAFRLWYDMPKFWCPELVRRRDRIEGKSK